MAAVGHGSPGRASATARAISSPAVLTPTAGTKRSRGAPAPATTGVRAARRARRGIGAGAVGEGTAPAKTAVPFESALSPDGREYNELPQLQEDGEGRIWLAFRHRSARNPRADGWAAQGRWDTFATAFIGDRWTPAVELPASAGRNDMRAASQ